jgi:hypothetical protein
MFFVYFGIYRAFESHRLRQIYRQKVIKKHLESTILQDLSHVVPSCDEDEEGNEDEDDWDEEEEESECESESRSRSRNPMEEKRQFEPSEEIEGSSEHEKSELVSHSQNDGSTASPPQTQHSPPNSGYYGATGTVDKDVFPGPTENSLSPNKNSNANAKESTPLKKPRKKKKMKNAEIMARPLNIAQIFEMRRQQQLREQRKKRRFTLVLKRKLKKRRKRKPEQISAAKERRGVKVLGIILGCFTLCWLPFFTMYMVLAFCDTCPINQHVEMFITWLGYANSAVKKFQIFQIFIKDFSKFFLFMDEPNHLLYTVFNLLFL